MYPQVAPRRFAWLRVAILVISAGQANLCAEFDSRQLHKGASRELTNDFRRPTVDHKSPRSNRRRDVDVKPVRKSTRHACIPTRAGATGIQESEASTGNPPYSIRPCSQCLTASGCLELAQNWAVVEKNFGCRCPTRGRASVVFASGSGGPGTPNNEGSWLALSAVFAPCCAAIICKAFGSSVSRRA